MIRKERWRKTGEEGEWCDFSAESHPSGTLPSEPPGNTLKLRHFIKEFYLSVVDRKDKSQGS